MLELTIKILCIIFLVKLIVLAVIELIESVLPRIRRMITQFKRRKSK